MIKSKSLVVLVLATAACSGGGKKGDEAPRPPQSQPVDSEGDDDRATSDEPSAGPSKVESVDAGLPGQGGEEGPEGDAAKADVDAASLALDDATEPRISHGPVADRLGERQLVCRYSAVAYPGSKIDVSVKWERLDGEGWSEVGGGDFLTVSEELEGARLRCSVLARDGKGREASGSSSPI